MQNTLKVLHVPTVMYNKQCKRFNYYTHFATKLLLIYIKITTILFFVTITLWFIFLLSIKKTKLLIAMINIFQMSNNFNAINTTKLEIY